MRKALFVISIFALLCALAACMPVAKYYVCPDGHQVLDPDNCEQTPAPEQPAAEETANPPAAEPTPVIVKEITPETQALLDKSVKAITVRFSYFESTDPYVEDSYLASRDKMRIELKNKAVFTSSDSYDTVYYDFAASSAFGYCERQNKDTCPDKNKRMALDYDDYIVKTPFDWLNGIEKAELTGRSKMIQGMTAKEMSFQSGGKQGSMFVDSFYGVPLSVTYEGITYNYQNIAINDGKLSDLVHQEMVNI